MVRQSKCHSHVDSSCVLTSITQSSGSPFKAKQTEPVTRTRYISRNRFSYGCGGGGKDRSPCLQINFLNFENKAFVVRTIDAAVSCRMAKDFTCLDKVTLPRMPCRSFSVSMYLRRPHRSSAIKALEENIILNYKTTLLNYPITTSYSEYSSTLVS